MKKILILAAIFIIFQNVCFAQTSVPVTYTENNLWGLKYADGTIAAEPQYKKLIKLGENGWIAQKKNRFGIIDNSGRFIVKPKYRHADRVFGKFAKLGNDSDYGLYDEYGNIVIAPQYSSIEPLFGKMFLTCKNYKYGVVDFEGNKLLNNEFDDIYMPRPTAIRLQYEGQWYEIERLTSKDIELPEGVKKVIINDKEFKVTKLVANTGLFSGYYAVTMADYSLKILSSISPAYEQTIDDLMLLQGAETVSIFMKLGWLPRFPFTYAKKYFHNLKAPNNGPLSGVKNNIKKQMIENIEEE